MFNFCFVSPFDLIPFPVHIDYFNGLVAFCHIFVIISLLIPIVLYKGEYCGENKIPFGIEVHPNAQPLLHCSRPSCFERRYADCDDRAQRKSCESNDSWVGGFEKGYGNHQPLYVQCCAFEGLADHSSPLYHTIIKPGQYFEGEEQVEEETDTVISFDVITDFKMIRPTNLSIFYEMTVRRLRCHELPPVDRIKRTRRWP
ncbi:unnamed protein product [Wuchereria bancrofti]|uniref:Uncharacterized protein n=3 Tax=Wuchereria bancrofti TaxID=6293 RepID=A0A3P7DN70_WUCBA|nr:unnamed protein product [Wuchereria bancrofti]